MNGSGSGQPVKDIVDTSWSPGNFSPIGVKQFPGLLSEGRVCLEIRKALTHSTDLMKKGKPKILGHQRCLSNYWVYLPLSPIPVVNFSLGRQLTNNDMETY